MWRGVLPNMVQNSSSFTGRVDCEEAEKTTSIKSEAMLNMAYL